MLLRPTVLHYTGSVWDGSGIHAVIRQLGTASGFRSIIGVAPRFGRSGVGTPRAWRGPDIEDDSIGPRNAVRAFAVAWRVRRWLAGGAHRVFHGHSRAGLLVALWLRLLGARRVVASVHVYGRHTWFYRFANSLLAGRVIWLTPAMKRHYGLADTSWAGCLPNGLAGAIPQSMRPAPDGGRLRVGGAGMIVDWKRWDLVLEAMSHLPAGSLEFRHIGCAVETPASQICWQRLRDLVQRLKIESQVHWLGWQPSSAALLSQVDVVVVPSDGEPFSMIALEALFAGVPVIATRGGGPEDFIVEGVNGWLVAPGDATALAAAFRRCLDPEAWKNLRVDPSFMRRFSIRESLGERWADFYRAL